MADPLEHLDTIIRETLTAFIEDESLRQWCGKEHDYVNRYAHGHLMPRIPVGPLQHLTQIGIEVGVATPSSLGPGRAPAARKDLVIWPEPWMSVWSPTYSPANHPLAVLEWKVRRPGKRLVKRTHDHEWLLAYSAWHEQFVGYAVTVDVRGVDFRLLAERFLKGKHEADWLRC